MASDTAARRSIAGKRGLERESKVREREGKVREREIFARELKNFSERESFPKLSLSELNTTILTNAEKARGFSASLKWLY